MNYTINGVTKIITPTDAPVSGVINIDAQDMYSRWIDWMLTSDNSKYLQAMRVVGGDPLPGSKKLGITYFLLNGWKIKPYEATHVFTINGNMYAEDGTSPYISTIGAFNVTIISSVSNLVDIVSSGGGSGGLTTEQAGQLAQINERVDIKVSDSVGGGGGGYINYDNINNHTTRKIKEVIDKVETIPKVSFQDIEIKLESIKDTLAKDNVIHKIEETDKKISNQLRNLEKEVKVESISTRNLTREKSKKINENIGLLIKRQEFTDKRIEEEADDIENEIERIFEEEADKIENDIFNQEVDKIENEINSNQEADDNT